MTTEEKAKRYDEAIKRIENIKTGKCETTFMFTEDLFEHIFPELKESEDEQHRKWILEYLYDGLRKSDEQFKDHFKCAISWLEKQGKNNMGISETTKQKLEDNLNKALEKETPESCNEFLEKQGEQILANSAKTCKDEQKPVEWSEDLVKEVLLSEVLPSFMHGGEADEVVAKLDEVMSTKVIAQPKQEWSEEYEKRIKNIEESLLAYKIIVMDNDMELANYIEKDIEWLKSLKDRYTWKPSDEQMDAVKHAKGYFADNERGNYYRGQLEYLLEQLEKIREE